MGAARAVAQEAEPDAAPDANAPDASAAPDVSPERAAEQASPPGTTSADVRETRSESSEQSPFDPHEHPHEDYHHVGVFARGIIAPQFIQNIFADGGFTALNAGVGGFYNYRRDGLNIIAEVWWAGFHGSGAFKGVNEPDHAMEIIESELEVVFGNIVLMWSIPIASWLAIELGFGIGFGGVMGNLYRTEAYPDGDGGWEKCAGPLDPNPGYCPPSEAQGGDGQYGASEPYNFTGGVPPVWFWLDLPRVAVRIKPLRQLQIRVEGGFTGYAFHAGGSLAFGF